MNRRGFLASSGGAAFAFAGCAMFLAVLLSVAGVALGFDDAHDVRKWRELTDAFDDIGFHASLAVPVDRLNEQ